MSDSNKRILQQANAAVTAGDNEGFLAFCADDIVWKTVGGPTVRGKQALRAWMEDEYKDIPVFTVHRMVAEGDAVVAIGDIETRDPSGHPILNAYCDVWRFRDGKMVELAAYVIR